MAILTEGRDHPQVIDCKAHGHQHPSAVPERGYISLEQVRWLSQEIPHLEHNRLVLHPCTEQAWGKRGGPSLHTHTLRDFLFWLYRCSAGGAVVRRSNNGKPALPHEPGLFLGRNPVSRRPSPQVSKCKTPCASSQ